MTCLMNGHSNPLEPESSYLTSYQSTLFIEDKRNGLGYPRKVLFFFSLHPSTPDLCCVWWTSVISMNSNLVFDSWLVNLSWLASKGAADYLLWYCWTHLNYPHKGTVRVVKKKHTEGKSGGMAPWSFLMCDFYILKIIHLDSIQSN